MMKKEVFDRVKNGNSKKVKMNYRDKIIECDCEYGKVSSWAVWKDGVIDEINDVVIDLNNIETQKELEQFNLKNNVILVALNAAYRKDINTTAEKYKFKSFHEETKTTSDHRLKAICGEKSILNGAYITDLVKRDETGELNGYIESNSKNVKSKLKSDKLFYNLQIDTLLHELGTEGLNSNNPIIICLGGVVYEFLNSVSTKKKIREQLGETTQIIKIPHYSKRSVRVNDVKGDKQVICGEKNLDRYIEVVNGFLEKIEK